MLALYSMFFKVSTIKILIFLTLKNINYKASIIGILMMLALKNINYKASIIGILMMLALKKINYKASIHTSAQRWMGKNTFPILLLNDDNMIGEHQETRMKMPNMCPFEKIENN